MVFKFNKKIPNYGQLSSKTCSDIWSLSLHPCISKFVVIYDNPWADVKSSVHFPKLLRHPYKFRTLGYRINIATMKSHLPEVSPVSEHPLSAQGTKRLMQTSYIWVFRLYYVKSNLIKPRLIPLNMQKKGFSFEDIFSILFSLPPVNNKPGIYKRYIQLRFSGFQ